jgi:hypothetical protein
MGDFFIMANYNEKHKLPSNGVLYTDLGSDVVLRNMTTSEEKMLLGSTGDALDNIIKACVVEPKNLNLEELISTDKHFLLLKLRVISYGSDYHVSYKCPECGKSNEYLIDLDSLNIDYLAEDFVEPYDSIELRVSKKVIELRIPRIKDLNDADTRAKRFNKKFPLAQGDIGYIYRLMTNIATVDGEEMKYTSLQELIEGLHTKDSSFLRNKINKLKVGIDTEIIEECKNPKCGADISFDLPITSEFFRTRYED